MGKSVEGCKAQETAGPQKQSLEGSEGRRARPGILRLPKRTILSSAPRYRGRGVTDSQAECLWFVGVLRHSLRNDLMYFYFTFTNYRFIFFYTHYTPNIIFSIPQIIGVSESINQTLTDGLSPSVNKSHCLYVQKFYQQKFFNCNYNKSESHQMFSPYGNNMYFT